MKISNRTVFTFNTKWIGWTTGSGQLQDQRNLGQFSRQLGQHIAPLHLQTLAHRIYFLSRYITH